MTNEYCIQALAWKKDQDYTEGLRLFLQRYGKTITYDMLCRGSNQFFRDKLFAALMEGVTEPAAIVAADPEPAKEPNPEIDRKKSNVDDLDSEVSDLRYKVDDLEERLDELTGASLKPEPAPQKLPDEPAEITKMRESTHVLMNERVALKQRLRDLPDPQERDARMKIAFRIMDITNELDILFAKIDYYIEFKRIPEQVAIDPDDIMLPRELLNVRTYISRTLKKVIKEQDPRRKKELEKVLEGWRSRYRELEAEL
jgi:hypothetical protein